MVEMMLGKWGCIAIVGVAACVAAYRIAELFAR